MRVCRMYEMASVRIRGRESQVLLATQGGYVRECYSRFVTSILCERKDTGSFSYTLHLHTPCVHARIEAPACTWCFAVLGGRHVPCLVVTNHGSARLPTSSNRMMAWWMFGVVDARSLLARDSRASDSNIKSRGEKHLGAEKCREGPTNSRVSSKAVIELSEIRPTWKHPVARSIVFTLHFSSTSQCNGGLSTRAEAWYGRSGSWVY